jgi:flagellar FliL protein
MSPLEDVSMADEENNEPKKNRGILKILMFIFGGLFLIAAGLGAGFFLFGSDQPDPSEEIEQIIDRKMDEAEEKKASDEEAVDGEEKVSKETPEVKTFMTTYFEFPGTFTTNLMNSRRFLQVGVGVSTQYDDTVMGNVDQHQLALRSEILNTMSEFSEADIQGKSGREKLAKALADAVNGKLVALEDFGGVSEVHFTSFVLQ